jgi:FtsZ-interacting cell division protein ZipA
VDTGVIIAIVVVALIVLALLFLLGRRGRERRHETRRHEAREIRREAEVRTAEADEMKAEADERAARARREDAAARQQVAQAQEREAEAEAQHARAHDVDPDTKGDYEPGSHREREPEIAPPTAGGTDREYTDGYDDRSDLGAERPAGGDDYEERRVVREGDPNDPDAVREERIREQRPER